MEARRIAWVWSCGLAVCALACGPDQVSTDSQDSQDSQDSASAGTSDATSTQTESDTQAETTTSTGEPDSCEPVLQADGTPSGFEECESGALNRLSAETCTDPFPPELGFACNEMYGTCSTSEDCVEQPYGSCQMFGDFVVTCECRYGCTNDSECGEGEICLCAPLPAGSLCVEAECTSDADCPGDLRCGLSRAPSIPSATIAPPSLHCRTPEDSCAGDLDCGEGELGECRFDGESWSC